jgi:hypothetical protein
MKQNKIEFFHYFVALGTVVSCYVFGCVARDYLLCFRTAVSLLWTLSLSWMSVS